LFSYLVLGILFLLMTKQTSLENKKFLKKKQAALKFFAQNLSQNLKREIKAVYLFGSLAHGKIEKDSDIDVLVFSDNPRKTSSFVWKTSLAVYEKFGESIEPLVYPSKKYENPNSYFLYQIINQGKRLYP